MNNNSFLALIDKSIKAHWDWPVMTDFSGEHFTYKRFAQEVDQLQDYLQAAGIQKGDKVAICGKNSARWAIAFFATLQYGSVAVSILHEFNTESVHYIVNHSDTKLFFVDESIFKGLNPDNLPQVTSYINLDNFELLHSTDNALKSFLGNDKAKAHFEAKYKDGFNKEQVNWRIDEEEELAVINYTSGTTSNPKGVMIPYRSMWSNTVFANVNLPFINPKDDIVCMLPMAHTYGLAFEILNSISMGCHIHFLGKVPSPKVLIAKFAEVKPKLVLAVPLIIEKIVTKNVFPKINKGATKTLRKLPIIGGIVDKKICQTMRNIFGGNLDEVVIGGAALNDEVEAFLRKIKFPYTVGYGMTECGPLISYAYWTEFKKRSSGRVVDRMEVRIDSKDPQNIVGEIQVRGANVMQGYFKNPEATKATFTEDGWLRTGDLGLLDKDNFVFIKGRSKNMILGPSGQNIYPEEIEDKLNNVDTIMESLAISEDHKIVALIVPDADALKQAGVTPNDYNTHFDAIIKHINSKLPAYSKISSFRIQDEEFEKTPKRSIRRFKYQK